MNMKKTGLKVAIAAMIGVASINLASATQIHADYQTANPAFVKREASKYREVVENNPLGDLAALMPLVVHNDANGTKLLIGSVSNPASMNLYIAHGKKTIKDALGAYIDGLLNPDANFIEGAVAHAGGNNGSIGNGNGGVAGAVDNPADQSRNAFKTSLFQLIDAPDLAELEALDGAHGRVAIPANLRLKTLYHVEDGIKHAITKAIAVYMESLLAGKGNNFILATVHNAAGAPGHVAVPVGDANVNINYPATRSREAFTNALIEVVDKVSF